MGAGPLAALEDMGIVDKKHIAGRPADHLETVRTGSSKGQGLPEHTAGSQLLHHRGYALLINADQQSFSPLNDPHRIPPVGGEIIDELIRTKRLLHRLKTIQHTQIILVGNVRKQRTFLQFLPCQHGAASLLHISQIIIAGMA